MDNQSFFQQCDSEEKAYWLGFLYADGCVLSSRWQVSIILSRRDSEHLEKLASIFNRRVRYEKVYDKRTQKTYERVRLILSCKKLVQDLATYGIVPRKTYSTLDIPWDLIPNVYRHHFIRGIFDGDGHVGVTGREMRVVICANSAAANSLKKILCETVFLSSGSVQQQKKKNMILHTFQSTGKTNVWKIREYLYKDATVCLPRKREIFFSNPPYGDTWFRGVHKDHRREKWLASKRIADKRIYAGQFDTDLEAAIAYDEILERYGVSKTKKNFPIPIVPTIG